MSIESQQQLAETFVREVVRHFSEHATTTAVRTDDAIHVEVDGDNLGLLVGARGATVEALQELTRTVVQRHSEDHTTRIVVDVAGYRARRAAALRQFAAAAAADVLASGTPEALEAMSAADRKVVHDAVNEIEGVETTSEGVEPRRYVLIRPATAVPGSESSDAEMAADGDLRDAEGPHDGE